MTHSVCPAPGKDTIPLSRSQHLPSHLAICSIAFTSSAICQRFFFSNTVVQPMPLCSRPSAELVTTQWHSCLKHLPEGLKFCSADACLRPDEDTINRKTNEIQSLNCAVLPCTNKSFKRKEVRRAKMANRSLDSRRRHERGSETHFTMKTKTLQYWSG